MCLNCPPLKNAEMFYSAISRRIPEDSFLSVTHKPELDAYALGVEGIPIHSFVSLEDKPKEITRVVNHFVEYVNNWYKEHKKEMENNNWNLELKKLVEEEK